MDNYIDVIFVWSGGILQILFWSVLEICGGTFRIRRLASCTFINFHLASLREVKHINGNNTIWDFFFSPLVAGHWVCSNGNHRQQLKPTHESRPSLPTLRVLWISVLKLPKSKWCQVDLSSVQHPGLSYRSWRTSREWCRAQWGK